MSAADLAIRVRGLRKVYRIYPSPLDVVIEALPLVRRVFPNVKYVVGGKGGDAPRLKKLALDFGVLNCVIFTGYIKEVDLVAHYRLADCYVMPSQGEGFGITYLEAMACGIPVIAGDSDGSAEPLQNGLLGWQVDPRDPEHVASACLEALKGNGNRCNGRWLRTEALGRHGIESFTRRVKNFLKPNN